MYRYIVDLQKFGDASIFWGINDIPSVQPHYADAHQSTKQKNKVKIDDCCHCKCYCLIWHLLKWNIVLFSTGECSPVCLYVCDVPPASEMVLFEWSHANPGIQATCIFYCVLCCDWVSFRMRLRLLSRDAHST